MIPSPTWSSLSTCIKMLYPSRLRYGFPLAHRVLEKLGIDFFIVPQSTNSRTKADLKRDAFTYGGKQDVYHYPNVMGLRSCPDRQKLFSKMRKDVIRQARAERTDIL